MALGATLLVAGTMIYAAAIAEFAPDFYYRSVQEDEYVEWATFWALFLAGGIYSVRAVGERAGRITRWALAAGAVFCVFVAMEEISWAQRALGYRPPSYFLAHNDQLETNFHNAMEKDLRKLMLSAAVVGFGLGLPFLSWATSRWRGFEAALRVAPPLYLTPAFGATYLAYAFYPLRYTGEWVELMFSLGLLFTAIARHGRSGREAEMARHLRPILACWLVVLLLGVGSAAWSRTLRRSHPGTVGAAQAELAALETDLRHRTAPARCGLHKRLYSFAERYGADSLHNGEFAALVAKGLPPERAEFFLDPWNSPYWIRTTCGAEGIPAVAAVYSLGPNRVRDSIPDHVRPDDISVSQSIPGPGRAAPASAGR